MGTKVLFWQRSSSLAEAQSHIETFERHPIGARIAAGFMGLLLCFDGVSCLNGFTV